MSGEKLKEGLDGLSKIDNLSDILYDMIYWLGAIFIVLVIMYIFISLAIYIGKIQRGTAGEEKDDFLDD